MQITDPIKIIILKRLVLESSTKTSETQKVTANNFSLLSAPELSHLVPMDHGTIMCFPMKCCKYGNNQLQKPICSSLQASILYIPMTVSENVVGDAY